MPHHAEEAAPTSHRFLPAIAATASLLIALAGCNSHPDTGARAVANDPEDVRRTVWYLASDALEGRGVQTRGIDRAADYIANRFTAAGLQRVPGQATYFQSFPRTSVTGVDPATSLDAAGSGPLKLDEDFAPVSFSGEGSFQGDVVFAGYGITNAEHGYDDYKALDVSGKVVLVFRYDPHDEKGKSRLAKDGWSKQAGLMEKAQIAAKRGAKAVVLVNPPEFHGPDTLVPFSRQYPGGASPVPFVHVKQAVVDGLLAKANAPSLQELQAEIDKEGKPHSRALNGVSFSGNVKIARQTKQLRNVMAWLPGAGPKANEYVVVGAHYDHLGYGGPGSLAPSLHQIHNGADDNASGTTALIELAEKLAARRERLPRSVLFVAFTGEELGLIGSQYLVDHPPLPLDRAIAMLNFDMVGRLKDDKVLVGGNGTADVFDPILKRADEASPLKIGAFGKGGVGPSDHTSFALKRIPVLFFFTGLHSDYHRPTDDADKINFAGITQIVDLSADVLGQIAALDRKPAYIATADANPHAMGLGGPTSGPTSGSRVTLGVVPDYGQDESVVGVRITGTTPGSPAEKAGLQAGDVVTSFGDRKIANLYDLTDALQSAKAGDKVRVKAIRAGKVIDVEATLAERR